MIRSLRYFHPEVPLTGVVYEGSTPKKEALRGREICRIAWRNASPSSGPLGT
jgi:hypothetical protein